MTYPDITPHYEVRKTISDESNEVVGFAARNKRLGHSAIVMKESAVEAQSVSVPLIKDVEYPVGEVAVLRSDEVLVMGGVDYGMAKVPDSLGNKQESWFVDLNHDDWRTFERSDVEVSH